MVEHGDFIEIYRDNQIEICEQGDVKCLCKKAHQRGRCCRGNRTAEDIQDVVEKVYSHRLFWSD
jgi:hypothetical protein